jgi:hypothetical protein
LKARPVVNNSPVVHTYETSRDFLSLVDLPLEIMPLKERRDHTALFYYALLGCGLTFGVLLAYFTSQ